MSVKRRKGWVLQSDGSMRSESSLASEVSSEVSSLAGDELQSAAATSSHVHGIPAKVCCRISGIEKSGS